MIDPCAGSGSGSGTTGGGPDPLRRRLGTAALAANTRTCMNGDPAASRRKRARPPTAINDTDDDVDAPAIDRGGGYAFPAAGLLNSLRPRGSSVSGASPSTPHRLRRVLAGAGFAVLLTCVIVYTHAHSGTADPSLGVIDRARAEVASTPNYSRQQAVVPPRDDDGRPLVYVAALVRDMSKINSDVSRTLAELSCSSGVAVHVVAGRGVDEWVNKFEQFRAAQLTRRGPNEYEGGSPSSWEGASEEEISQKIPDTCQSLTIVREDPAKVFGSRQNAPTNRVDRIAALRDYQRELLRPFFASAAEPTGVRDGAVIVVDLDLAALGPIDRIDTAVKFLSKAPNSPDDTFPYDVVCAAGVTVANRNQFWCYDTYATIFLPDTFIHPLKRRLVKLYYPGVDPMLVRSDSRRGKLDSGRHI